MDGDRLLVERVGDASRTHAERLPLAILEALETAGLTSSDVDLFAVAAGPGSFTGLRIGIATIQGFAFVHGRRVAPVSALRALAEVAAADTPPGARVAAWMDAHRRDVFSALYEVVAPRKRGAATAQLIELDTAQVGPPAATLARWSTTGQLPKVVAGDGAALYAEVLKGIRAVASPPLASVIARLAVVAAAAGEVVPPGAVLPLYIRRPDAEVARETTHARR
jgi:tRNA threonylcarbamoyladenosine biosynthesis protein TsaB